MAASTAAYLRDYLLYYDVFFNHGSKLYRQLVQVGNIQKGISINPLDIFFVVPDSSGHEQNSFPLIFLLDAAEVFLSRSAVITVIGRLPVRNQDEHFDRFRPFGEMLGNIAQNRAVPVLAAGPYVH